MTSFVFFSREPAFLVISALSRFLSAFLLHSIWTPVASTFQNRYIFRVLTMAYDFPHGVTSKKREGTQISVESQPFQLTRLISERVIAALQERVAVFEGQRLLDGAAVVLKLRFQYVHLFQAFLSYVRY